MSARKPAAVKPASKKIARPAATHPTWVDMIKECIAAHPDDARHGVSRPQIKRFVETEYKLEIGAAQNTQLSKALGTGTEKGIFVLPKGPSGRVKLAPKAKAADTSATKENKPAAKPKAPTVKPKVAKAAATKATTTKSRTKPAAAKKATTTKTAVKKAPAPKKALAGKAKTTTAKKTTTTSKRGAAKKVVTGTTAPAKAKAAARKAPAKRTVAKPAAKTSSPRKKPTKRS